MSHDADLLPLGDPLAQIHWSARPFRVLLPPAAGPRLFLHHAGHCLYRTPEQAQIVRPGDILFDGGASIGLRRFRVAAVPIAVLGVLGTFATAGIATVFVHYAL